MTDKSSTPAVQETASPDKGEDAAEKWRREWREKFRSLRAVAREGMSGRWAGASPTGYGEEG